MNDNSVERRKIQWNQHENGKRRTFNIFLHTINTFRSIDKNIKLISMERSFLINGLKFINTIKGSCIRVGLYFIIISG